MFLDPVSPSISISCSFSPLVPISSSFVSSCALLIILFAHVFLSTVFPCLQHLVSYITRCFLCYLLGMHSKIIGIFTSRSFVPVPLVCTVTVLNTQDLLVFIFKAIEYLKDLIWFRGVEKTTEITIIYCKVILFTNKLFILKYNTFNLNCIPLVLSRHLWILWIS